MSHIRQRVNACILSAVYHNSEDMTGTDRNVQVYLQCSGKSNTTFAKSVMPQWWRKRWQCLTSLMTTILTIIIITTMSRYGGLVNWFIGLKWRYLILRVGVCLGTCDLVAVTEQPHQVSHLSLLWSLLRRQARIALQSTQWQNATVTHHTLNLKLNIYCMVSSLTNAKKNRDKHYQFAVYISMITHFSSIQTFNKAD